MKNFLRLLVVISLAPCSFLAAQCLPGYSTASLNWDNLDFLKQDPTYISASQAQTQYFAFGANRVTILHNYAISVTEGENATHTGETGSYGTGDDVQLTGNGTVTISFQTAVQNVRFSIYDIDYNQMVTVTATNGAIPQIVSLARATTTQLTVAGSGTTSASATGAATTAVLASSNDGTANVDIAGPITSITLTITQTGAKTNGPASGQEDGSFWISDISACDNTTAFPTSYFSVSQPYTGQPGYVLAALDDTILMVNPANGASKVLFADPTGNNINSMAYDPYNRFIYYTYSLTNGGTVNANNKSVQRYDVTTGTLTTIISNVNTLGIPTYTSGVESGGAAFYNGALYIGIEGIDGDESKIWRINFDGSFNPIVPARQVFSVPTATHDWSDFTLSNGVLYDFNGKSSSNSTRNENILHYNLQTGATIADYRYSTLGFVPRQVAVDWTEKLYNIGTAATSSTGTVVPYANGAIAPAQQYTISKNGRNPSGSWGDAGDAFRPYADFGDAPASYDPVALSPALHEISSANLRIGTAVNEEDVKKTSAMANADTDDGMPFVAIVNQSGNYLANVNVYNNTGAPATVCAWVDFNNDGIFSPSEGISETVQSSTSLQSVDLFWASPNNTLQPSSFTFLRVRITSATNGMTANNPTGYFGNGEVEDYRVSVNYTVLPVDLVSFTAKKATAASAKLQWEIADELAGAVYELERSIDGQQWSRIDRQRAGARANRSAYEYVDAATATGILHYRLKIVKPAQESRYSPVCTVDFGGRVQFSIASNPVHAGSRLLVEVPTGCTAAVRLIDMSGRTLYQESIRLQPGKQSLPFPSTTGLPLGTYEAQLWIDGQRLRQRFTIAR